MFYSVQPKIGLSVLRSTNMGHLSDLWTAFSSVGWETGFFQPSFSMPNYCNARACNGLQSILNLLGDLSLYTWVPTDAIVDIQLLIESPLKKKFYDFCSSKILSHHGDVAPCVIDIEVDLSFFPNTPLDRDTEIHHRVCTVFYHYVVRFEHFSVQADYFRVVFRYV